MLELLRERKVLILVIMEDALREQNLQTATFQIVTTPKAIKPLEIITKKHSFFGAAKVATFYKPHNREFVKDS